MNRKTKFFHVFIAAAMLAGLAACTNKGETFTDIYYLHNNLDEPVSFHFYYNIYWDTCTTYPSEEAGRTWFEKDTLELMPYQTVRLHPVSRKRVHPESHQLNVIPIIGSETKLIIGHDTLHWLSGTRKQPPLIVPCMFGNDSVYSIYNVTFWQTEQLKELPNTYKNTFHIIHYKL